MKIMTKLHNLIFLLHFIFQRIAAFGIVGTAVKRAVSALPQHQLSAAAGTKSPPQGKPPISDLVIDLGEVLFPCLRVLDVGTQNHAGVIADIVPQQQGLFPAAAGTAPLGIRHQLFSTVLRLYHL